MNSAQPPRLAAWILKHFGPKFNNEALAGDLWEGFQQGRSKAWYWRQVLATVRWGWLLYALLVSVLVGWWLTSPIWKPVPTFASRSIDMAVITAVYFASLFGPGMMRRRLRILLALLITAILGLLWRYNPDVADHYWIFFWLVACNFVFHREISASTPAPYHLPLREMVFGDPDAERQRLLEKLHLALFEETDPEVRHAYAESIAALRRNATPAAKATQ